MADKQIIDPFDPATEPEKATGIVDPFDTGDAIVDPFARLADTPPDFATTTNLKARPEADNQGTLDDINNIFSMGIDTARSGTDSFRKTVAEKANGSPALAENVTQARDFSNAVSSIGAGWQYGDTEVPPVPAEQVVEIAKKYREQNLITEEELQKVLANPKDMPIFGQPQPMHFYDKSFAERAKDAPQSIAAGVNATISGWFRGMQWLEGEAGVNIGSKAVADWFQENAAVAGSGVRPDFFTDVWGGVGSVMTLVGPQAVASRALAATNVARAYSVAIGVTGISANEALVEAGSNYGQVLDETGDIQRAEKAARITFGTNLPLLLMTNYVGIYSGSIRALKTPPPTSTLAKAAGVAETAARGAAGEAAQEAAQEVIGQVAREEEFNLSDALYSGLIGGILGAPTAVLLDRVEARAEAIPPLSPELQSRYDATVSNQLQQGTPMEQAHIAATQDIATTPEGEAHIEAVMSAMDAVMQLNAALGQDVLVEDITPGVEAQAPAIVIEADTVAPELPTGAGVTPATDILAEGRQPDLAAQVRETADIAIDEEIRDDREATRDALPPINTTAEEFDALIRSELDEDAIIDEIIARGAPTAPAVADVTALVRQALPTATAVEQVETSIVPDLTTEGAQVFRATMPNGTTIDVIAGAEIAITPENIETLRKTYVEPGLMTEEDLQAGNFVALGKNQAIGQSGVITLAKEGVTPEVLNEEVFELAEKTVLTAEEIAAAGPDLETRSKAYAAWDGETATPQGAFEKIRDFFKNIADRIRGITRPEDVFRRVREGEVFEREGRIEGEETFAVRKPTDLTQEQLELMDTDKLDLLAFGFNDGDIITIEPENIEIKFPGDLENPQHRFDKEGMKWARSVDLSEPVNISFEDDKFFLEDGHHRWFAAQKTNRKLKAEIEIKANPVKKIQDEGELIRPSAETFAIELGQDPIARPIPISDELIELTDINAQIKSKSQLDTKGFRATKEQALEAVAETINDNPGQPRMLYRVLPRTDLEFGPEGVLQVNPNYQTKDIQTDAMMRGIYWTTSLKQIPQIAKAKNLKTADAIVMATPVANMPQEVIALNTTPKGSIDHINVAYAGDVKLDAVQIKDLTDVIESDTFEVEREVPDADIGERARDFGPTAGRRDIRGIGEPGLPGAEFGRPEGRERVPGELGQRRHGRGRAATGLETFSVEFSPKGRPIFDAQGLLDGISLKLFSANLQRQAGQRAELPAFMFDAEGNQLFTEQNAKAALEKVRTGAQLTQDQREIVLAALAEASTDFYQEAISREGEIIQAEDFLDEDVVVKFAESELDAIVEKGMQEFIGKLKVETIEELTPEQKKLKETRGTVREQANDLKALQRTLKDKAFVIDSLDKNLKRQQEIAKDTSKEARAEKKRLTAMIERRNKQIDKLRAKTKEAARTVAKETVKGKIRKVTGQVKPTELIREDKAFRESLRREVRAAKQAFREGRLEAVEASRNRINDMRNRERARKRQAEDVKRVKKRIKRLQKAKQPNIAVDYQKRIKAITDTIDVKGKPTSKTLKRLDSLREWMEAHPETNPAPDRLKQLERLSKTPLRDFTPEALAELEQTLKDLENLGRLKQALKVNNNRRELEKRRAELIEGTVNNYDPLDFNPQNPTLRQKLTRAMREFYLKTLHSARVADTADGNKHFQGKNAEIIKDMNIGETRATINRQTRFVDMMEEIQAKTGITELTEESQIAMLARIREREGAFNQIDLIKETFGEDAIRPVTADEEKAIDIIQKHVGGKTDQLAALFEELNNRIFPRLDDYVMSIKYVNEFNVATAATIEQQRHRTTRTFQGFTKERTGFSSEVASVIEEAARVNRLELTDANRLTLQIHALRGVKAIQQADELMAIKGIKALPELTRTEQKVLDEALRNLDVNRKPRIDIFGIAEETMGDQEYYIEMEPRLQEAKMVILNPEYRKKAGDMLSEWWAEYLDQVASRGWSAKARSNASTSLLRQARVNLNHAVLGYKLSSIMMQPFALFDASAYVTARWGLTASADLITEFSKAWIKPGYAKSIISESGALQIRAGGEVAIREMLGQEGQKSSTVFEQLVEKFAGESSKNSLRKFSEFGIGLLSAADVRTAAGVREGLVNILKKHNIPNVESEADFLMSMVSGNAEVTMRPQILGSGEGARTWFTFQTFMLNRWGIIANDIVATGLLKGNWKGKYNAALAIAILMAADLTEDETRKIIFEGTTGGELPDENAAAGAMLFLPSNVPFFGNILEAAVRGGAPLPPILATLFRGTKGARATVTGATPETQAKGAVKAFEAFVALMIGIPGTAQIADLIEGQINEDNKGRR